MIFHSGDKKFYKDWLDRETKGINLTGPWNNPDDLMFATELLEKDNIRWFIGINGSSYTVIREEF